MNPKLRPDQLRRTYSQEVLSCTCTDELEPLTGILGQDRALEALRFAVGMREAGYNVYASGLPGTGKATAVRAFLAAEAAQRPTPPDWCYVYNFQNPHQAKVLKLPSGTGRELQRDMAELVERAKHEVVLAFESDVYRSRRESVIESLNKRKEALLAALNEEAQRQGFAVQATPMGIFLAPLIGGQPADEEQMQALAPAARGELESRRRELESRVREVVNEFHRLDKAAQETVQKLNQQVSLFAIGHLVDDLEAKYHQLPEVQEYLRRVQDDMVQNVEQLRPQPPPPTPVPPFLLEYALRKYQVNLVVDNAQTKGAPVVMELNPIHNNLFGRLEKESQFGALVTDFTLIQAGSVHRANGGYLVVRADDLLRSPFSWEGLKRCLRDGKIEIEEVGERIGMPSMKTVMAEPIPLDVKVVIIGTPMLYYLLQAYEPEFHELFRVRADFDTRIDSTPENVHQYLCFFGTACRTYNQKHLDSSACAKLLEHSARLAEDQEKLSTRFASVVEVLREAHYWATQDGSDLISARHVQRAIDHKVYRSNLIQERIVEMIERGAIHIETEASVEGQVNGLSVLSLGDFSFGKPTRITASVSAGREGLMDIEREAKLGGPIHTKGVLIISGYLGDRYAHAAPLSLAARVVFEQSYDEVEGDSASSAELYCLLSRLADLPIDQGLAVTGSVDQKGRVQAIGGVNQKIEGFFEVCKAKGLTGKQGVLIPASNVQNLMLREDVVEAVQKKQFHVYSVSTVDEGIEILTGVKAGRLMEDGTFEKGSVNERVRLKLQQLAQGLKEAAPSEPRSASKGETPRGLKKPPAPPLPARRGKRR